MRIYLLPGLSYIAAVGLTVALGDHAMALATLSASVLASVWWMITALRARGPLPLHLAIILAPLAWPIYLGWVVNREMQSSDIAAMGLMFLLPFMVFLIGIPLLGFYLLLARALNQPPRAG